MEAVDPGRAGGRKRGRAGRRARVKVSSGIASSRH
jgi:hypothetical protein